jgi:hypothetical protein
LASVSRPPRFAIAVPVKWRPRGADDWRAGVSINVSRSGVLIETDRMPSSDTLEFVIVLSQLDTSEHKVADALCAGRIVRCDRAEVGRHVFRIAVTIDTYSLIRTPD